MRRLLVLLVVALLSVSCGGNDEPQAPVALSVPDGQACSEPITLPDRGADHVESGQRVEYATDPPASGPHAPSPVRAGIYDQALPDEATVHNLEHGHVIVHHNGLPADVLAELEGIVRADPVQMLVAPRPSMPWVLAFTAWTVGQVCDEVPDDPVEVLRRFVRAHRDNAPESVQ